MKRIFIVLMSAVTMAFTARAQWTIDSLNMPGLYPYSAAAFDKAVFTNGGEWNVFNASTNTHTYGNLSVSRALLDIVTYGDKIYLGGGKYGSGADPIYTNKVDVYDAVNNSWTTLTLSKAREVGGAGAAGDKIVFAGGTGRTDISGPVYLYATADIFDVNTGVRTTGKLSKARSNIATGAAGSQVVFAGGWYWDMNYNQLSSNAVDIYDASTGLWTKTTISQKRENIGVAVVGNKIIFAGGDGWTGIYSNVDVYDVSDNSWTVTNMPTARYGLKSVVVGDKAYFAGGLYDPAVNEISIYNTVSNTWSTIYMPVTLTGFSMSVLNDKIYFAGGYIAATSTYSNLVQIYEPATGSWSTASLSVGRNNLAAVTALNKGYFAGGYSAYGYPVPVSSKRVDILSVASPLAAFTASATVITQGTSVNFTDQSTNNPTSWLWTFNGGNPSSSTVQHPGGIQYLVPGSYDVTLVASNSEGSNSVTKFGYITVNPAPCAIPSGMNTTDITASGATFNWNAVSGATKYKVSWKITGNNPWTTTSTTTNFKAVTGLSANTGYVWKVKSICDGGMSSSFSSNTAFTTSPARQGSFENAGIAVYPNPVTDQFRISIGADLQLPFTCTVFDFVGNVVSEFVMTEYDQSVQVRNWPAGNYYVRVVDALQRQESMMVNKQ